MSEPDPGWRRALVYADEGGTAGASYLGFGSLWLPWERRGDFQRILGSLREKHAHQGPLAASLGKNELVLELVDALFHRRWLSFRAVITPLTPDTELRRLALVELLARRARAQGADLRLRLSRAARLPDDTRTKPQAGIEALLRPRIPTSTALSVRAARTLDGIELCELLTGLVVAGWERKPQSKERHRVADRVAENLGWADLAADTAPSEWKMNIWFLRDPRAASDAQKTARAVQLRLPMFD